MDNPLRIRYTRSHKKTDLKGWKIASSKKIDGSLRRSGDRNPRRADHVITRNKKQGKEKGSLLKTAIQGGIYMGA